LVLGLATLPDFTNSIKAIQNRHRDIDQNHLWIQLECRFDERFAVDDRAEQIKLIA
jgi:hypothetical protein